MSAIHHSVITSDERQPVAGGSTPSVRTSAAVVHGNSATSGITTVSGDLLLIGISLSHGSTPSGVIDSKGNTWSMTPAISVTVGGITDLLIYAFPNCVGGSAHTIQLTGAPGDCAVYFIVIRDAKSSGPIDTAANGSGISSSNPTSATTSGASIAQSNSLAISIYGSEASGSPVTYSCSGFTIISTEPDNNSYYGGATAYKSLAATTPVTAAWSQSGGGAPNGVAGIIIVKG